MLELRNEQKKGVSVVNNSVECPTISEREKRWKLQHLESKMNFLCRERERERGS